MERRAVQILSQYDVMAIATNRPDGWPQATMVGFVNIGLHLFFYVSRSSQKYANIMQDDRVSIAVGGHSGGADTIMGVSMAGKVAEVTQPKERDRIHRMYLDRLPAFAHLGRIDYDKAALMRVTPRVVSIVDFRDELGHTDRLYAGSDLTTMGRAEPADWGLGPFQPPPTD